MQPQTWRISMAGIVYLLLMASVGTLLFPCITIGEGLKQWLQARNVGIGKGENTRRGSQWHAIGVPCAEDTL